MKKGKGQKEKHPFVSDKQSLYFKEDFGGYLTSVYDNMKQNCPQINCDGRHVLCR